MTNKNIKTAQYKYLSIVYSFLLLPSIFHGIKRQKRGLVLHTNPLNYYITFKIQRPKVAFFVDYEVLTILL